MSESYLLILGDRQAIAWVLREQRMAFPATSRSEVDRLAVGDELLIYTTRGAYRNPTRDRGQIIGTATVTSPVERLGEPVEFGGREFPRGCAITLRSLVPWRQGVELQPLVERLDAFPNPKAWSIRLRRPLLRLPAQDAALLRSRLEAQAGSRTDHLDGYLAHDRPPLGERRSNSRALRSGDPPADRLRRILDIRQRTDQRWTPFVVDDLASAVKVRKWRSWWPSSTGYDANGRQYYQVPWKP